MLAACSREPEPVPVETPPPAVPDDPGEAARAERRAKQAAAREAEEAKAAAEAERVRGELDRLAQLPAKLPKSLPKACDAMVAAYDGYMRKVLTDAMLTKWVTGGNEMQLKVFRAECMKRSIEVAACQATALAGTTRELYPHLADLMETCATKFGAKPDVSKDG